MLINGIEYTGEITKVPPTEKQSDSSVLTGFVFHIFAKGTRGVIKVQSFRARYGRYPEKGELLDKHGQILPYGYSEWKTARDRLKSMPEPTIDFGHSVNPVHYEYGGYPK
ncbi:MAG: hypothetical protein M1492_03460 [Gammaproteobacteria bacterium]|nr:hypothetical protein [Gammaproteobacteria bacterium]